MIVRENDLIGSENEVIVCKNEVIVCKNEMIVCKNEMIVSNFKEKLSVSDKTCAIFRFKLSSFKNQFCQVK